MPHSRRHGLLVLLMAGAAWAAGVAAAEEVINPFPSPGRLERVARWEFADAESLRPWTNRNDCRLTVRDGVLEVVCEGPDPFFVRPVDLPGGRFVVKMKAAGEGLAGPGRVYWITRDSPGWGEDKAVGFPMIHDGRSRETSARLAAPSGLRGLRIDPGAGLPDGQGLWRAEWIELWRELPHPLVIESAESDDGRDPGAKFRVRNTTSEPVAFTHDGQRYALQSGATVDLHVFVPARHPIEAAALELLCEGQPPLRRTAYRVNHGSQPADGWIERKQAGYKLQVARNGSIVRMVRNREATAILGPLVLVEGEAVALRPDADDPLCWTGEGVRVRLVPGDDTLRVVIESERAFEGPILRVFGALEQGLLAGVEHLGRGERSSSKLDIETDEHLRFEPAPLHLTMPLAAFVTDLGAVAMTWSDARLQPTFATPNFYDGASDHRASLKSPGKDRPVEAVVWIGEGWLDEDLKLTEEAGGRLEDAILWAVKHHGGLPPPPEAPRSPADQQALNLCGLSGPLRTAEGWGHCVEERWPRRPFADMASTVWRLTGEVPELPQIVPGGAHVPNDAIYFVTGGAEEWLRVRRDEAERIIAGQQPDGSFRYDGPYRRGHFEDTALGTCARPAARLLEFAWLTGDEPAQAAGLRTLEFMRRFRTPRGGQTWEIPLHTPDLLASAYAVWACVRGYELTGDERHLHEARRWALAGVPFVYLRGEHPVMLYATVPVLGATDWKSPNWIGLPVQWVGLDYAYALTKLAPHDRTLDWNRLARGILVAGEQMQYPDGPRAGLLPDAFELRGQERRPWNINPCALVSLRRVLDGQVDSLAAAVAGDRRVVAPFPVTIEDGHARVRAPEGTRYQVLVDGRRVVEVVSTGDDRIALE